MACLTEEQLASYLAGSLSAKDTSLTEEHLRECAACRERLERLRADEELAGDLRRAFGNQTQWLDDEASEPAVGRDRDLGAGESERHPTADSIPGYEITREIHRGGQGVVYQAIQKATKRKVAIKVMREGPFAGKRNKARFEREVRILGQLRHPNIVTVHDSGTTAGCFYYTMDYVPGRPLDEYVTLSKPSIDQTLRLFAKICEAVNAAHLQGVIHRDLKPGNIRIDVEGVPHVLDFGLAKVAAGQTTEDSRPQAMTVTGEFMGSLPWASPEQTEAAPGKIDLRTDVYSLGVILYQMLTGQFPYPVVRNVRDVMDNILKTEPAKPSTIRRQINDEIETIVLKSLSKERERRYQTAGELGRDIERYLAGEPIEAKRDSGLYVLKKTLRRYRVPVGVGAAFVVLLAASLVVSLTLWARAARERDKVAAAQSLVKQSKSKVDQALRAERLAKEEAAAAYSLAVRKSTDAQEAFRLAAELSGVAVERADLAYRQAAERHAGDSVATALLARAALDDATRAVMSEEQRAYWEQRLGGALGALPRLVGSTRGPTLWTAACFSPRGQVLATGSSDGDVVLWDLTDGQAKIVLSGHRDRITAICFSSDGDMIASASDDKTVKLWNVVTGEVETSLTGHTGAVTSVTLSPDAQTLASGSADETIRLWSTSTGKCRGVLEGHSLAVTSVAFSPDGRTLASGSLDTSIRLWDVVTYRAHAALHGHRNGVVCVAIDPKGERLASASRERDRSVLLWDGSGGTYSCTCLSHPRPVNSVSFSPDGQLLACGSTDGTVRLWDAQTWESPRVVGGQQAGIAAVCFSPDGQWLATASDDKSVKLWDVAAGEAAGVLEAYLETPACVCLSPDGRVLASGLADGTVKLRDVATGDTKASLEGHTKMVWDVCFSPDGQILASGSGDGTIRLWDGQSGSPRTVLREHEARVWCVCFSTDGRLLASGSDDRSLKLWDVSTAEVLLHQDDVWARSLAFSPTDQTLACGMWDGRIALWDVANARLMSVLSGHRADSVVWSVAFSPGGRLLASGSTDRTVRLWDVSKRRPVSVLRGHGGFVYDVCFHPKGQLLASGSHDGTVRLWETAGDREVAVLRAHAGPVGAVCFSRDGGTMVSASEDGTQKLWVLPAESTRVQAAQHRDRVCCVCFDTGGRLLASGSADGTVRLLDAFTGQTRAVLRCPHGYPRSLDFSPDVSTLASGSSHGVIQLWDVASGLLKAELSGHEGPINRVLFSPDGQVLASASGDRRVMLWHVEGASQKAVLTGHGDAVRSLAFAPDGLELATASQDKMVRLWDVASGALRRELKCHGWVYDVAFSPDGRLLASAVDRSVVIWEIPTWRQKAFLHGHTEAVLGLSYSPDGRVIASGSLDHTIRLWDAARMELRTTLQARAMVFGLSFSPDGHVLASGLYDGNVVLWDIPRALPSHRTLERLTGARIVGFEIEPLPMKAYRTLVGIRGTGSHVAPTAWGRSQAVPQNSFLQFAWNEWHPFCWVHAAEAPDNSAHAQACYRLGIIAERNMDWERARKWHQRAIDAGAPKWVDCARWRLKEMPVRIEYLASMAKASRSTTTSAPSTCPGG